MREEERDREYNAIIKLNMCNDAQPSTHTFRVCMYVYIS